MAIEVVVPRLGWSMDEGTFSKWLKRPGEWVKEGDPLFELEGDKATQEVESFDSGELRIPPDAPQPGDAVKVGQTLAWLCAAGEVDPWQTAPAPSQTTTPLPSTPQPERAVASTQSVASQSTQSVASPSVRRLARALEVDLTNVVGTGRHGAICEADVYRLSQTTPDSVATAERGTSMADKACSQTDDPLSGAADFQRPSRLRVSPRAAKTAASLGVDLAQVAGGGADGRIRQRDVLAAAQQTAASESPIPLASGALPAEPPSATRRTIAQRLSAAWTVPQATLTTTADARGLTAFQKQLASRSRAHSGRVPGYTDVLLKLAAGMLARRPALMSQWTETGVVKLEAMDISVAVDTPHGLVTPVIRNVDRLSLDEIAERLSDLVARAQARRISADEFQGGVLTLSNLGVYRVDAFTPILNPPQAAILGVGRIAPRPIVEDGTVVVRDTVALSLTFDHRIVDGAAAAAALTTLCEFVANPLMLLLD